MMWPFNRKYSLADNGVFQGFTDWHSHLLPEADDGVRTIEEALDILALYEKLGVKSVWLTPHVMEDLPNTTAHLNDRFKELKAAYKGPVLLHLAAEYMLDSLFRKRLDTGDLLPLGEKRDMLLVETSYYNPPIDFCNLLERIKARGLYPVLAHPERCMYMNGREYRRLKEAKVQFQLNLPSLIGLYGKVVRNKAEYLLSNGFSDRWGTDCHSFQMAHHICAGKLRKSMLRILSRTLI